MASAAVSAAIAAAAHAAKLELDSASAADNIRWLNHSDDDDEDQDGDGEEDDEEEDAEDGLSEVERAEKEEDGGKAGARKSAAAASSSKRKSTAASRKANHVDSKASSSSQNNRLIEVDELVLEPSDALKLKVVIEAIAPALLQFRKGSRQIPFRDVVPRDPALLSPNSIIGPPPPATADEVTISAYYTLLKQSWPVPERIERLKTIAIVQLPRDLEAEADHADGTEQDTYASLADALEAALGTDADNHGANAADESREEEDFVRLRNVIFLVASIRRQFFRLLRNPSAPSGVLQPDPLGRNLPALRHKPFRIVSVPTAPKPEEVAPAALSAPNGTPTSPAAVPAPPSNAPVPIALTRADGALTSLWTQAWFTEILRGSTLALALLNELADKKRTEDEALKARVAAEVTTSNGPDDSAFGPSRKRARLDDAQERQQQRHPPKLALHMRLGAFGDFFTNAVDMPRKFWERQQQRPGGAEGTGAESTDEEESDGGPGSRLRRRTGAAGRRNAPAPVPSTVTGAGAAVAAAGAAADAALQAAKRGKAKSTAKGMGKGWRKGRTKAMEEIEEVNREEERRRDRWAMGDLDFGPASVVAIMPYRSTTTTSAPVPTLGERLRANGPVSDLSLLAHSKSSASQDPAPHLHPSPSSTAPQKRFPGRLADFLYYNQYASFAPSYDTSRSTGSGEGTAALWWMGRQGENRMRRFHEESAVAGYVLPGELARAFGGGEGAMEFEPPLPPPLFDGLEGGKVETGEPRRLLDGEDVMATVGDQQMPSGDSIALDPELLQKAAPTLATVDEVEMAAADAKAEVATVGGAEDGDEHVDSAEAVENVLRQNQYLLQALVVLQGQRLLAQVRQDEKAPSTSSPPSEGRLDMVPEVLPVERLIARELLLSLNSLVALRPRSANTTLIPSADTLRAASSSTLLPSEEPAYWGTLTEAQYTQSLPLLLVDQIHREPVRKGPLVLRDNMAALLADKPAGAGAGAGGLPQPQQQQHQQHQVMPGFLTGFPPSATMGPSGEPANIYTRRTHTESSSGAYPMAQTHHLGPGGMASVAIPAATGNAGGAMYPHVAHASPARMYSAAGAGMGGVVRASANQASPYNHPAYASPQQQDQQHQTLHRGVGTASPARGQGAKLDHLFNHH
ncbi:hypothetical protein A4X06_0g4873 [Tilletia controversa]|uniref:Uncharacterized protein n=1 Tax=Tilletia controversa TaxID=13291 RepID=A0A8X7MS20_9BASI|nr:hypothetical protein A4X06_0g4873 [Tilletia controversa]